jgi:hypothetical protein
MREWPGACLKVVRAGLKQKDEAKKFVKKMETKR